MIRAIAERHSCREYSEALVSDEDVDEIVKAGMRAPSAANARPWHIVIVRDEKLRAELSQASPYASFCTQSPVVFVVCGDDHASDFSKHWWIEDCSAAVENMLLQATDLGLSTCWIGIRGSDEEGYDREEAVRQILGIPENIRVSALISCGHPAAEGTPKPTGPMENVHHDGW